MLKFDLNLNPPTAEEITEARQAAESAAKRRDKRAALFLTSSVTALAFVGVFALVIDDGTASITEYVAVFGLVAIAFFAPTLLGSDKSSSPEFYSSQVGTLGDISPDDCVQFIADCLADPLCEQYRQKVAAIGRKPVAAEVMMIREWVADRRKGAACALVASKEPLPSDADTGLKGEQPC